MIQCSRINRPAILRAVINMKAVTLFALLISTSTAFTTMPQWRSSPTSNHYKRNHAQRKICLGSSKGDISDAATIQDMMWRMTTFFGDMTDPSSHRFYYVCLPPSEERIHQHMPIRDLAAAWDATKALLFWEERQDQPLQQQQFIDGHSCADDMIKVQQQLKLAVYKTIQVYNASYIPVGGSGGLALDPNILLESSNIAHSALLILITTGALRLSLFQDQINGMSPPLLDDLVKGILSMQRSDGAFQIEFGGGGGDNNVYRGIEFFPGEAMVALMDAYDLSAKMPETISIGTRAAIILCMERAFDFYAHHYKQGDVDTNYNVWQVQAFARLVRAQNDSSDKARMFSEYCLEMCQDIVNSKSWRYQLARGRSFYPNLSTVEIACGLDALIDGIPIALDIDMDKATILLRNSKNALDFLQWVQAQGPRKGIGCGGLGYGGIQVLEQRLDVTGHTISALSKMLRI